MKLFYWDIENTPYFFTIVLRPGGKNRTSFSLSFCLDTKERKNQGAEFLFCSQILILKLITTRCEQDNSFLKLKFFNNVLVEILKINSFKSVAKTMKFKAEYVRLRLGGVDANSH